MHNKKMSFLIWLGGVAGIILFLIVAVYLLLFTGPGNKLLAPVIENKIGKTTSLPATLEKLELRPGRFSLALFLGPGNRVEAEGSFGIFSRNLKATYRVLFDDLSVLQPFTKTTLYGKLRTDGLVMGRFDDILITGSSDIAASKTTYSMKLVSSSLDAVKVRIVDAEVARLLEMTGKKPFSRASLTLDLDIRNIDPRNLDGELILAVGKGAIDTTLMEKEFGLVLPKTLYTTQITSRLEGRKISYKGNFESNLARLFSEGTLSPELLHADLKYEVDVKELALFKPLTNSSLRGPLKTSGVVKGNRQRMVVSGTSDIGAGRTGYDITLKEFETKKVLVRMRNGKLAKLLYLTGYPEFAIGTVNVDLALADLNPENLKGNAEARISEGKLVPAVFRKEYDITLPETTFTSSLIAELKGEEIDYRTEFDSNLAGIGSEGVFVPKTTGMDLGYKVDIKKLELLQPFSGIPLRGVLKVNGTARGDREKLDIEGTSDLAGGKTGFRVGLSDFTLSAINAKVSNVQLARVLYMLAKPLYADGLIDADIDIANAKKGELKGNITTIIDRGRLDGKVIADEFDFGEMPKTSFTGKAKTTLSGNVIDTAVTLDSTMAYLKIDRMRYDLDASLLSSDYQADIPDLDRFYFAAGRHLNGSMAAKGTLAKGEHLKLTAHSDTLGGKIDFTVLDDDVHGDFKKIQTLDALRMLIYPEILAATLDGSLDYNLKRKKGVFSAGLNDGKFNRNVMLDLLLALAEIDLYKERFNGSLASRINGEMIDSDFELRSKSSAITGKNVLLNSEEKIVDADLDVLANNNPVIVTIKGKVDKPDVKLDTSALIKKEATKLINKEVNKLLKGLFK